MHMMIYVIVHAPTQDEALMEAEWVIEDLCVNPQGFDWYNTFAEERARKRWGGEFPTAAAAASAIGQEWIAEGLKFTQETFRENLQRVRTVLAHTSDAALVTWAQGLGTTSLAYFRYICYQLGLSLGSHIWLYDQNGQGILTAEQLTAALKPATKGLKAWVVPADVHF